MRLLQFFLGLNGLIRYIWKRGVPVTHPRWLLIHATGLSWVSTCDVGFSRGHCWWRLFILFNWYCPGLSFRFILRAIFYTKWFIVLPINSLSQIADLTIHLLYLFLHLPPVDEVLHLHRATSLLSGLWSRCSLSC